MNNSFFYFVFLISCSFFTLESQVNSVENVDTMTLQQNSELLLNLPNKYINFINNIGSRGEYQVDEVSSLFSQNCKKNFNGRWVANNRNTFVTDLVSVYQNYGSWKLIPIDIINSHENKSIILRINIEAKNFGDNTAIIILRYNSDYLIEEIIEVFSPIQGGYDFDDNKEN